MGALSVASAHAFAPSSAAARSIRRATDASAPHVDVVRPSRIGGAPLSGARAVSAYQRTMAVDAQQVLSRIDELA